MIRLPKPEGTSFFKHCGFRTSPQYYLCPAGSLTKLALDQSHNLNFLIYWHRNKNSMLDAQDHCGQPVSEWLGTLWTTLAVWPITTINAAKEVQIRGYHSRTTNIKKKKNQCFCVVLFLLVWLACVCALVFESAFVCTWLLKAVAGFLPLLPFTVCILYHMCVSIHSIIICGWGYLYTSIHLRTSEDSLKELILPFHGVGSWDWT